MKNIYINGDMKYFYLPRRFFNRNRNLPKKWGESLKKIGKPEKGFLWINLKLGSGGVPIGRFIQVPKKITNFKNIKRVISKLEPTKETSIFLKKFNLPNDFSKKNKDYLFGYFIGVLIGDSSKDKLHTSSRTISLGLSKKHDCNERFGDFFSLTTNLLGIRMIRRRDRIKKDRLEYFWRSKNSLLADYIFEKILGLKEKDLTTYDQVNLKWMKKSPKWLKIGFIQGVCDSDGSKIHLPGRYLRIFSYPNSGLIREILIELIGTSKGIKLRKIPKMGKMVNIVWIRNTKKIEDIFEIPIFNPYVNSYRYKLLESFVKSKTFQKTDKETKQKIREEIKVMLKNGIGIQEISERILSKYQTRFNMDVIKTVKRYINQD
ncbi:hypothetical protein HYV89_01740 [Candidatus Woesearchaeota archaeon]|nr:hypothetical protein [Candidatus Woesearchaeota archaeon]